MKLEFIEVIFLRFGFGQVGFGEYDQIFRWDGIEGNIQLGNGNWFWKDKILNNIFNMGNTIIR